MNRKKQNHEKEEEDCICKVLWVAPCLRRKRPYTQALLLCLIARPHCKPNSYYHQGVGGGLWIGLANWGSLLSPNLSLN